MEDKKIQVAFELMITQEDIDDIMCGALEGGIDYWCCEADVVGDYLGTYASEQISRGGELLLQDAEEDMDYLLTLDKLIKGITLWVKNGPKNGIRINNEQIRLDCCMIDAPACDQIIQYALFGEILFA